MTKDQLLKEGNSLILNDQAAMIRYSQWDSLVDVTAAVAGKTGRGLLDTLRATVLVPDVSKNLPFGVSTAKKVLCLD